MNKSTMRLGQVMLLAVAAALAIAGCGSGRPDATLYVGGIPDQDVAMLEERFEKLAEYLSDELDLAVEYVPSNDYAAVVTGFRHGDIHLGWFGGLTGVQARLVTPGAEAIAQRPRDEEFHSVFVANPALGLTSLADVAGHSLTFGSESSTSGHLMPRYFMLEAGVDPQTDVDGAPSYAASHDATWKLVESGAFEVGALNEAVWEQRTAAGEVDLTKVDAFYTTPPYYDYHWIVRDDLDETFRDGTREALIEALLAIDEANGGIQAEIAEAFQTDTFIATTNSNYDAIEAVARQLGIIEE